MKECALQLSTAPPNSCLMGAACLHLSAPVARSPPFLRKSLKAGDTSYRSNMKEGLQSSCLLASPAGAQVTDQGRSAAEMPTASLMSFVQNLARHAVCYRRSWQLGGTCDPQRMPPLAAGKLMHCYCGGDDPSTQFLCDKQPVTNWDIFVTPSDAVHNWDKGNALARVNERAGAYSQVCPLHLSRRVKARMEEQTRQTDQMHLCFSCKLGHPDVAAQLGSEGRMSGARV
eukprot:1157999-Pelagomonas_calceolata.AAC.2